MAPGTPAGRWDFPLSGRVQPPFSFGGRKPTLAGRAVPFSRDRRTSGSVRDPDLGCPWWVGRPKAVFLAVSERSQCLGWGLAGAL